MKQQQVGFTLVEIAIVLVIIGLLLGGILKGQELINSARVRNLADTASGIQAAYYGFIDRYRRVPGDWDSTDATLAIGVQVDGGGDNNGRLDDSGAGVWVEPNALWEQLSKSGFINGGYTGASTEPGANGNEAPLNAFNAVITMGRTADYFGAEGTARLHLVMGRSVPVSIMRELDVKLDDGSPDAGVLRASVADGASLVFGGARNWGGSEATCVDASVTPPVWNITSDSQDCNSVYLY